VATLKMQYCDLG